MLVYTELAFYSDYDRQKKKGCLIRMDILYFEQKAKRAMKFDIHSMEDLVNVIQRTDGKQETNDKTQVPALIHACTHALTVCPANEPCPRVHAPGRLVI